MNRTYQFQWKLDEFGKGPLVELELDSAEYEAIGRVSAQWAFLDFHITKFVTEVCEHIGEQPHKNFESDSFRKRKRVWSDTVKRAFPESEPARLSMEQIIADAGSLQGDRQIAIHAFFEFDKTDPDRLVAFSHKNPHGQPRRITANDLNAIAEKISRLNARFMTWPGDSPELVPGDSSRYTARLQKCPKPLA